MSETPGTSPFLTDASTRFPISAVFAQRHGMTTDTFRLRQVDRPTDSRGRFATSAVRRLLPSFDLPSSEPPTIPGIEDLGIDRVRSATNSDQRTERDGHRERLGGVALDHLAWYRTFRTHNWGIFIRRDAVMQIADALHVGASADWTDRLVTAFSFLYQHEYGHFLFDHAAQVLEGFEGRPLWEPHRTSAANDPWSDREEALCNALAFRDVPTKYRKAMRSLLLSAPHGYNDYPAFTDKDAFTIGVETHLLEFVFGPGDLPPRHWRGLFEDHGSGIVRSEMVPLYIVD